MGGSADSDLSVKSLTTEELTIGPDHEEPQEAPDEEIGDEEDENESVHFVQLGKEILQVGHTKKRKSDGGNRKSGVLPPGLQVQVV